MINKIFGKILVKDLQSANGALRRQIWTHPALGTATGVHASIVLLAAAQTILKNTYSYTVTSAAATIGAVYTDGVTRFTVVATIAGATTLILTTASAATLASGTLTKISGTGDTTIAFSAHGVTSAIAALDFPRTVTIVPTKAGGSAITGNVVIVGTNIRGEAVTDTIACGADTVPVEGVVAFATITSIAVPVRQTASDGITIGTGTALGLDRCMSEAAVIDCYVDGVRETTPAVVTYSATDISLNTIAPNTALANTKIYKVAFIATELTNKVGTTA